jgi:hypothetical protein
VKPQTAELHHSRSHSSEDELRAQALPVTSMTPLRAPFAWRSRSECQCSLADLVRELLHPLLKDWLDQNLPNVVERCVNAEIERLVPKATQRN